ncbi:MAG: B12-binding domain-containing radical SAM protein [Thermodesulfobacteriota bacterium]
MKIALVTPINNATGEKSFYDYKFITDFIWSKKYFSYLLAIPVLISLTPEEHEIRVFDENIEQIDFHWKADLVGISIRTMYATRAYEIADQYRRLGIKTVLGGIHVSMCPEEALEHGDAVVIGEAEHVWENLLEDARQGRLQKTYISPAKVDLTTCKKPGRHLLARERYFSDIVQSTKGCPFDCEFCSVHAYDGQQIRHKTVEQVLDEIRDIHDSSATYKKKSIFFADDNIIANKKFARDLFTALKPYRLNWSCQASINVARERELLELMKASGCGAILIGFETISRDNLAMMGKNVNLKNDYIEAIQIIQSFGIMVHSSFIMGYDFDTPAVFDELIDFINQTNLLMPLINILTPFPGTRLFHRLEQEKRILHKDWGRYDGKHVVYKPVHMEPDELEEEFKRVVRGVYSFTAIKKKLQYYWSIDFWRHSNEVDPIRFRYRLLFALRLSTLLFSGDGIRRRFILWVLPRVFHPKVRISTILTLMAYNDFAFDGLTTTGVRKRRARD